MLEAEPDRSVDQEENLPEVSVVIPCLNEEESIGPCIEKAAQAFARLAIRGEIIVADNGSTDGSQEIAEGLGARIIHVETKGYGSALMGGIRAARGTYVIMGDADGSYDFSALEPFVEKLREGNDLVMGNRFRGGIEPGAMPFLHRYVGNPILSALGRLFFRSPVGDFHCGLRGFRKDAIQRLDLRTTGMEFASEMIVKATLVGLAIAEVPTTLSSDLRSRPSHLRTWRDGWRHLRFLLLYSPRWLFLYPGLFFMVVGTAVALWLLPGPRTIGRVTFDVQTLLYADVAIVLGFQSVLFSAFTKIFAINAGLLPEDPRLDKLFRIVTLEVGLAAGLTMALVGAVGSTYAFLHWSLGSFGAEDLPRTLRIVVPSITLLILGVQVVLASFFLSVLGMKRR